MTEEKPTYLNVGCTECNGQGCEAYDGKGYKLIPQPKPTVSQMFEYYTDQEQYDGHDIIRAMRQRMLQTLQEMEKGQGYPPEGVTIEQYSEVCRDILTDSMNALWQSAYDHPDRAQLLSSGNPSERMVQLRNGDIDPTPEDVAELLGEFMGAAGYTDYFHGEYTLVKFGHWLAGTGDFAEFGPAEVIW